jgi:fructose-1,6-bisphosphatase/inositol monophosphatase family enzyme
MVTKMYPEVSTDPFQYLDPTAVTVWVDPLDATNAFVRGEIEFVTCLVGISINGVARAGIIHQPFLSKWNADEGQTLFGSPEHGVYAIDYDASMTKE